ncbi:hypothetical protein [Marispirochaeta aestuarii]|jgi:hypothetical protein|uniref:hypothetical protein n=1 Tax=Marispirochaeta aestuarii TaxID=1963862 RepID=UPI001301BFDE|nr:hypothetical protein [Marispirochaeta aestuarii]
MMIDKKYLRIINVVFLLLLVILGIIGMKKDKFTAIPMIVIGISGICVEVTIISWRKK